MHLFYGKLWRLRKNHLERWQPWSWRIHRRSRVSCTNMIILYWLNHVTWIVRRHSSLTLISLGVIILHNDEVDWEHHGNTFIVNHCLMSMIHTFFTHKNENNEHKIFNIYRWTSELWRLYTVIVKVIKVAKLWRRRNFHHWRIRTP